MATIPPQKPLPASRQRSVPARYPHAVRLLCLAAFAWAFLGWLNESYLFLFDNPLWLNRYTEYAIILGLGVWRIRAEENPYTRKRLTVLVACVTVLWWWIPWCLPFFEPYVGYLATQPVFPALHTPGTVTFFLVLAAVFLFGRRVICGWNCPCVGIRETAGFAFRDRTVRGEWAWRLRHLKWPLFALYVGAMGVVLSPPNAWSAAYLATFSVLLMVGYFGTFFLSPLLGNRNYCRFLCPYGATFGLLNRVGLFRIDFNRETCTDCGLCDQVCDMGIPVLSLGRRYGRVKTAECMGCGRCVTECPAQSLAFVDARNLIQPALTQDRRRLRHGADWATPALRVKAVALALVLCAILAGAHRLAAAVGSDRELPTRVVATLACH